MRPNKQRQYLAGSFIKHIRYISVATIFLTAMALLSGCGTDYCGDSMQSIAYARGLSQERLVRLYDDVKKFAEDPSTHYSDLKKNAEGKFPEPFADLQAVRILPKQEHITLSGCVDNFVFLHFYGLESNKDYRPDRQIVLSWKEHEKSKTEIIWSE